MNSQCKWSDYKHVSPSVESLKFQGLNNDDGIFQNDVYSSDRALHLCESPAGIFHGFSHLSKQVFLWENLTIDLKYQIMVSYQQGFQKQQWHAVNGSPSLSKQLDHQFDTFPHNQNYQEHNNLKNYMNL